MSVENELRTPVLGRRWVQDDGESTFSVIEDSGVPAHHTEKPILSRQNLDTTIGDEHHVLRLCRPSTILVVRHER